MGKRSTKQNKNIYQLTRENAGLTRDKASEQMVYISSDRIEKIESEKSLPHPDEILTMAKCYKAPILCNYFCSHECPIGEHYVPEIKHCDLSQITLEMLASINALYKEKARLIEIVVDGSISDDEIEDFTRIRDQLGKLSLSADSLRLWLEQRIADGKMEPVE